MQEAAGRLREEVRQERPDDVDDDGVAEVALLNVFNLKYVFLIKMF